MRFAGIDIAFETHVEAIVDEIGQVLVTSTPFGEEVTGYQTLRALLGSRADILIALEATGHYWQNLFAVRASEGFALALLNPVRTRRFAEEDLVQAKTDAIDALGIARLAPTGHARLRAALWMTTLVAVRTNPWLRAHYERLRARGKLPKVALIAALHKLILLIYSVAKHHRPFIADLMTGQEAPA